jgi:hypothetical protein
MATQNQKPEKDQGHDSVNIIVNGRPNRVQGRDVSFEKVVALAFETPPSGPTVIITVTYRDGPPDNPAGTLVAGQTIQIRNGMKFNVSATDKS